MTLKIVAERVPLRLDSDGVARVGGTRVSLDTVVFAFEEGATAEEIVRQYPALALSDVYSVLAYYLHNRNEVEEYLKARSERERVRTENEGRSNERERVRTENEGTYGYPRPPDRAVSK